MYPGIPPYYASPGYMVGIHPPYYVSLLYTPGYTTLYTYHVRTVSAVQGVVQWPAVRALGSNPGIVRETEAHRDLLSSKV